jgi:hypothetical protein
MFRHGVRFQTIISIVKCEIDIVQNAGEPTEVLTLKEPHN